MCPELEEVCKRIDSKLEVEGRIVFLSDYGHLRRHFAIVQVEGTHVPLIVPVEDLQLEMAAEREPTGVSVKKDRRVG